MKGNDKAFLVGSDGQSLLDRGIERLSAVCASVAVSARPDQAASLRERLPVECAIICDRIIDHGPASALLAAYEEDPTATWLAFAVDFPLAPLVAFERLLAAHARHSLTCYENDDGFLEPLFAIWTPALLARLREQVFGGNDSPSYAIRTARKLDPDSVAVVKPGEATWLLNTNTPEQWAAAQAHRRHTPGITFAAAQERTIALANAPPASASEKVDLLDAVGRVAAAPVASPMALPPFRNAAMDGIVVRAAEVRELPMQVRVMGTIAAGDAPWKGVLEPGTCLEIMTGAALPFDPSFDSVIRNEDYAAPGTDGLVSLKEPVRPGQHVRLAGEDVAKGRPLLKTGTLIRPSHIGVLSAVGVRMVDVARRLRVGVLPTGSELSSDPQVADGHIFNSNGPTIAAFLTSFGHQPVVLPPVDDDLAELAKRFADLPDIDALVMTGGVSAGKFDHVPSALLAAGATFVFRSVAMRPGHPCHVATLPVRSNSLLPVFALPGNPLAALACHRFLVEPHLRARLGRPVERPLRRVRLITSCTKPRAAFVVRTGVLDAIEGTVEVLGGQGAGAVGSLIRADVWVALPVGVEAIEAGEEVEVWPLWAGACADPWLSSSPDAIRQCSQVHSVSIPVDCIQPKSLPPARPSDRARDPARRLHHRGEV
jgi:molybdopterin molybdotransferase